MVAKKKKKTVDKWKRKKWFKIVAPKLFNELVIGETPAEKEAQAVNRVVEASLADLTGQRKFRHVTVRLRITNIANDKATTRIIGCRVDNSYLKRMVRRRRTKVENIIVVETADKNKVKVSAVTICGTRVEKAKEKAVRKAMDEVISAEAKKAKFDIFMQQLMFGNISNKVFNNVKNIAPIQRVEIIKANLLEEAKR